MKIPFSKPYMGEEEIGSVVETLRSGWLTMGPKVLQFEGDFTGFVGCADSIAVNSCTAALFLAEYVCGIGPGDEAITTPFTFAATANTLVHLGAKPVFVDIREEDFNIDHEKIGDAITEKTKAIIPVHYGGQACEMDAIGKIAKEGGLRVIEDAAHALDARYKDRMIGTISEFTCFSFYATKNITTGEGGMISTLDRENSDRLRSLRLHGIGKDAWKRYSGVGSWYYELEDAGQKCNMTDLNAAIGIEQLKRARGFTERRRKIANEFAEGMESELLTHPRELAGRHHARHLYPILLDEKIDRNKFIMKLGENGVGTSVHFIPLHLQPFYKKKFGFRGGEFPVAESVYRRIVSLPIYPAMGGGEVRYVIDSVNSVLREMKP